MQEARVRMTPLERQLLKLVMDKGEITSAEPCEKHGGCLMVHLKLEGIDAPKKSELQMPMKYSPEIALGLSEELGS